MGGGQGQGLTPRTTSAYLPPVGQQTEGDAPSQRPRGGPTCPSSPHSSWLTGKGSTLLLMAWTEATPSGLSLVCLSWTKGRLFLMVCRVLYSWFVCFVCLSWIGGRLFLMVCRVFCSFWFVCFAYNGLGACSLDYNSRFLNSFPNTYHQR